MGKSLDPESTDLGYNGMIYFESLCLDQDDKLDTFDCDLDNKALDFDSIFGCDQDDNQNNLDRGSFDTPDRSMDHSLDLDNTLDQGSNTLDHLDTHHRVDHQQSTADLDHQTD